MQKTPMASLRRSKGAKRLRHGGVIVTYGRLPFGGGCFLCKKPRLCGAVAFFRQNSLFFCRKILTILQKFSIINRKGECTMPDFSTLLLAAGESNDFVIFISVAIVAVAILVIAIALYNRHPSNEAPPHFEPSGSPVSPPPVAEQPPMNGAVIYSGLDHRTVFFCPRCDCEYSPSTATCEICGKSLQRRNINDL